MRDNSYFYYRICDFGHFYEVRESGITIIFRPKVVFLDTDSISRVKPMYESVK